MFPLIFLFSENFRKLYLVSSPAWPAAYCICPQRLRRGYAEASAAAMPVLLPSGKRWCGACAASALRGPQGPHGRLFVLLALRHRQLITAVVVRVFRMVPPSGAAGWGPHLICSAELNPAAPRFCLRQNACAALAAAPRCGAPQGPRGRSSVLLALRHRQLDRSGCCTRSPRGP